MDNLMKFQRLMNAMAQKETDVCGDAMERLERLSSLTASAIQQFGTSMGFSEESGGSAELLYSSLVKEIGHYENLIARADAQLAESESLAESVKRVTVPLLEQVRAGYECYLTAYQMLCEGLQYNDAGCCEPAIELGREARALILGIHRSVEEMQEELPMVA
jgi:hypothetical protein